MTVREAQIRLETLCVRAEHSTGELTERLRRWGIGVEDTEKILKSLKKHKFVDDTRFARAYVSDKIKFARWGKRKVYHGMMMKKVDPGIIKEVLSEIDSELYAGALEAVLQTKITANPQLMETYEGRTKLYRIALSRGFEPQLCSTVLRGLIERSKEE